MDLSDVQKTAQYGEFFTASRGRRKLPSSHATSVDVLISGKPLHGQDKTSHPRYEHSESNYKDCAGMRSGSNKALAGCDNTRRRNAGPNVAMHSTMDQLIWGRDFDKSGADPRQHWDKFYNGFAGKGSSEKPLDQPARKGAYSMMAVMDEVIYGRDLDFSGSDPHVHFEKTYADHAGKPAGNEPHPAHLSARPYRKPTFSNQAVVDTVIYGHDLDGSGEDPHKMFMKVFDNHAGLKAGDAAERRQRKLTAVPKPVVAGLIFGGRENGEQSLDSHRDYTEKYGDGSMAGRPSSHRSRTKLRKDSGSQSQPALSARDESKTRFETQLDFISRARAGPNPGDAPQTARERPKERNSTGGTPRATTPRATTPRASGSKQEGLRRSSSTGRVSNGGYEVTPRRSQSTGRLGTEETPSKSGTGGTLRLQPGEESITPRSPAKPSKQSPYKFKQMSRSSSDVGSLTSRTNRSLTSSQPLGQTRWR